MNECLAVCGRDEIGKHRGFIKSPGLEPCGFESHCPYLIAYLIQRRGLESPVTPAIGTLLEYEIWRLKLYYICAEIYLQGLNNLPYVRN